MASLSAKPNLGFVLTVRNGSSNDEGESANFFAQRFSAFGLRKVFAIRREPAGADRAAARHARRVHIENIFAMMNGLGMVNPMHPQRFFIVVDGVVNMAAERGFYAGGSAAAAGEVIDEQFAVEVENEVGANHN